MKPIQSIAKERKACIAAFAKYPNATRAWCVHHRRLHEAITDRPNYQPDIAGRIRFIARWKARNERAIRFRNLRPVKPLKKGQRMGATLFNKQWPGNTWNEHQHSIFADGHFSL